NISFENDENNKIGGILYRLNQRYPHMNITITSILLWYTFSMSISVYNRWMFSAEKLNFKYPIIITSFHQLILTILAIFTLFLFPSFRLSRVDYTKLPNKESNDNESNTRNIEIDNSQITYTMPIKEYITSILPCSVASAGDIGLGNTSFRFISLSLYTMVKTSALIFVLLWGVFFKLEQLTLRILTIVGIMSFGVSMMVWGQKDGSDTVKKAINIASDKVNQSNIGNSDGKSLLQISDINSGTKINQLLKRISDEIKNTTELKSSHLIFIGVSLVLISACMSGLRWALTQIMLKKNKRTKNPILTMLYISPGMCIFLFLVGIIVEGLGNFINADLWEVKGIGLTIILILIPGFLAFFMTLSEYVLLQHASLLTLSIAGIFKELLTIFVSWVIFDDKLSFINIIGLVITFADIIWYNIYRFQQNTEMSKCDRNINDEFDNEFVDIELNNINVHE
ncbi:Triose-phosphate Transporter, partial [Pichia californica]